MTTEGLPAAGTEQDSKPSVSSLSSTTNAATLGRASGSHAMRTRHTEAQKGKGLTRGTHSSWTIRRFVYPPHPEPWVPTSAQAGTRHPPKTSRLHHLPFLPASISMWPELSQCPPPNTDLHIYSWPYLCAHTAHKHTRILIHTQMLADMSGAAHLHTQCHMHTSTSSCKGTHPD